MEIYYYLIELKRLSFEIEQYYRAKQIMEEMGNENFPVGIDYDRKHDELVFVHADQYFGHDDSTKNELDRLEKKTKYTGSYYDVETGKVEEKKKMYIKPGYGKSTIGEWVKRFKGTSRRKGTIQKIFEDIYDKTNDSFISEMNKRYLKDSEYNNYTAFYIKYYKTQKDKLEKIPFEEISIELKQLYDDTSSLLNGAKQLTTEDVAKVVATIVATIDKIRDVYKEQLGIDKKTDIRKGKESVTNDVEK